MVGEVRTKRREVIPFRAHVVVDDVEGDGQFAMMAGVDETLQRERAAVRGVDGVGIDAVVAPITRAGKLRERHEFDRRDAQVLEIGETRDDRVERAFGRERADVQLVENVFCERQAAP